MSSKELKLLIKDSNADVIFLLKNQDQLTVKTYCRDNPKAIYQNMLTNTALPLPIKNTYKNLSQLFKQMQFSGESKISLKFNQKQAQLSIPLKKGFLTPITLPLLDEIIETPNPKANPKVKIVLKSYDNKELKNLQEQQKQLDLMIQQLQQQVNALTQEEQNKSQILENKQAQKQSVQIILAQAIVKFDQTKKKFISNQIDFDQKYGKHIDHTTGKHRLFMKEKHVTDQIVKEIVTFDLRKIQILSFGQNQITDAGFNLLFNDKMKWPVLMELFLLKKATKQKISTLYKKYKPQKLSQYVIIYLKYKDQNELSQASCDYLCTYVWVEVKSLRVSFKKGINNECWKKLLEKLNDNFPKLKELYYSNEDDLSGIMKKKILDHCNEKGWSLNHSVIGGSGGNGLQEIIKLQLLANLLKGAGNNP